MLTKTKIIVSIVGIIAALALFLVKTDREFINLTPSPGGPENSVVLEAGHTYAQTFPATRTSVSRIGLYLRPQVRSLAQGAVTVKIFVAEQLRAEQLISASFIDAEGVSEVRLAKSIPVNRGEDITLLVEVPKELSGQIRALVRTPDETFDSSYARFTIDENPQTSTLAYQVYYMYRPPLAWQVAIVILLSLFYLFFPKFFSSQKGNVTLGIMLAAAFAVPALLFGDFPWLTISITAVAFGGMSLFLHRFNLSTPAIVLGASIFAFTTWWPLHLASNWQWANFPIPSPVSLQNIFLDSNQVPSANGGQFDHQGSYVGIMALVMSFLGLSATAFQRKILPYHTLTLLSPFLAIMLPDLIIVTTFGLSFFAAQGLTGLQNFLGKDKLITALCWIIALLVLLDLFHVGAGTLEFPLI